LHGANMDKIPSITFEGNLIRSLAVKFEINSN